MKVKYFLYCLIIIVASTSCGKVGRAISSKIAKAESEEVAEAEAKILGKTTAKEYSIKQSQQELKTAFSKSLSRSYSKEEWKNIKKIQNEVPSDKSNINKERRTLLEIAQKPIPDKLVSSFKEYCVKANISIESMNKIISELNSPKKIPLPSVDWHVDFSKVAVTIGKLPSKEELASILKSRGMEVTAKNIRAIHYELAWEAFAKRYGVTKKQAELIIGKLDYVIHESEDGFIELVPNNFHRFKKLYSHSGLVAKRVKELTGKVISDIDD